MSISKLELVIQAVIPTVYDDSLSYLEFLGKVMAKINELIDSDVETRTMITDFLAQFDTDLTATVTTYLDAWALDGTIQAILTASLDTFNDALDLFKIEINAKLMVNIKDYGALGDGIHDDSIAIREAIDVVTSAGGGTIQIPEGTFLLKTYLPTIELNGYWIFKLPSNITLQGRGEKSILKVEANINSAIIDGSSGVSVFLSNNRTNVHLKDFQLDFNGANNLVALGLLRTFYGVRFYTGENCSVENCIMLNCSGRTAILFNGFSSQDGFRSGAVIKDNLIHNGGSGVVGNVNQNDFSAIYCDWDNAVITGNRVINDSQATNGRGGVESHGNNNLVKNNYFEKCYPAIYVCSDFSSWVANKVYVAGDIIIPTRASFVGLQYKCTVGGTSGAVEPTWIATTTDNTVTWAVNGKAETLNQIIDQNTMIDCHSGIMIWNGGGDYNGMKIVHNTIGLKQSTVLSAGIGGITQTQGSDASGLTIPVIFNGYIDDNEIYENEVLSTASVKRAIGISVYSFDTLSISHNLIHYLDDTAIIIMGSPRGSNNLIVEGNIIRDYHINNIVVAKSAILFNLTGATTIPVKTAYDAKNISIIGNVINNTVVDATAYAFIFDWGAGSVITNLIVDDNSLVNVGIKAGAKLALVKVTPVTYFSSATGNITEKSGLIIQWTQFVYTATAGTDQTFTFTIPFTTVNNHHQVTLMGASDAYVSIVSKTATTITLRCSATSRTLQVLSVGQ